MAGLFWDILNELATVGHVALPARTSQTTTLSPSTSAPPPPPPANQHKRAHSGEHAGSFIRFLEPPTATGWVDPLVQQLGLEEGPFAWLGTSKEASALPMYSADLGRVHPQAARPSTSTRPLADLPNFMASSSTAGVLQQYPVVAGGDHTSTNTSTSQDSLRLMDNDTIAMWADAPTSLGWVLSLFLGLLLLIRRFQCK